MLEVSAPAKINLSLDITGIQENGYHTVDMVMQSVSLCDVIRMELDMSGEILLSCSKPQIPVTGKNTAYRAAQLFLDVTGLPFGVKIHIEKNIPDQAGMGGGSADAAAVLRGMNALCGEAMGELPLNTADILYIGMRIGADVPFCVLNGTKRCQGIGEILLPLAPLENCSILIIKPPVGISTPEAYHSCDCVPDFGVRYTPQMVKALESRSLTAVTGALGNRFEDALQLPQVVKIKELLLDAGASGALMTGSGSAVYGIFENEEHAQNVKASFGDQFGETFLVHPIQGE